jgi:hypothetical protein
VELTEFIYEVMVFMVLVTVMVFMAFIITYITALKRRREEYF